jgi:hypothetical protein
MVDHTSSSDPDPTASEGWMLSDEFIEEALAEAATQYDLWQRSHARRVPPKRRSSAMAYLLDQDRRR